MQTDNITSDQLNQFNHFYLSLKNSFLMPSTMALQVNRYRHAGDMTRENFSMDCQRSSPTAKPLRSDTQIINSP
jgi:hypothetical protein